jgi:hypothetical protein
MFTNLAIALGLTLSTFLVMHFHKEVFSFIERMVEKITISTRFAHLLFRHLLTFKP